jgi:hypothetical protein
MNAEIKIDPAEALRRIIRRMVEPRLTIKGRKLKKNQTTKFWWEISDLTGYGEECSKHIATSHGFSADTGEAL